MEANNTALIKSIEEVRLDGFNPKSSLFFCLEQINQNELILHGGSNSSEVFNGVSIVNFKSKTWSTMNDISSESQFLFFDKALTGHTCNLVWIQGTRRIVIQGGFNGESYSNYIYELETESFLWTQIDIRGKGEHPAPRNFHTSNYDQSNNLIVYYGGWDGNIFNQNQESFRNPWVFHLRNFSWEMINVNREDKLLPCRRGHTSELWRENRLLVFGVFE